MNDFLTVTMLWVGFMLLVITSLFAWSWYDLGDFKKALTHWKKGKPLKDMLPILWVPPLLVMAVLFLTPKSEAGDLTALNYFQVDAGLAWQLGEPQFVQCKPDADTNLDKLGSDLGFTLNGLSYNRGIFDLELNGFYRHHSCAVGADTQIFDVVGGMVTWRINLGQ